MKNANIRGGKLGPHELCEVELMLSGKKEVAYFAFDYPKRCFQKMQSYINAGIFEVIRFGAEENAALLDLPSELRDRVVDKLGEGPYENIVVYVSGAKEKALRLIELKRTPWKRGFVESIEREIGQILGYSEADINLYIASKRGFLNRSNGE